MKIQGRTLFDCSPTGITGHFRSSQIPFEDRVGQSIRNIEDWNRARNQQRNWETLQQMISLRAQPYILQVPQVIDNQWVFENVNFHIKVYSRAYTLNKLHKLLRIIKKIEPLIIQNFSFSCLFWN